MNTLHCCYPGPTWGALHSDTPSRFQLQINIFRVAFLEVEKSRCSSHPWEPITLQCACYTVVSSPPTPCGPLCSEPPLRIPLHPFDMWDILLASIDDESQALILVRKGGGLGPLSVSFLIRTSGKEFHSQAGSPRGVPDLGKIPTFSRFFFNGVLSLTKTL